MKQCSLCMLELDMCFPKIPKVIVLQYGNLGVRKGESDTQMISGLQKHQLNKRL